MTITFNEGKVGNIMEKLRGEVDAGLVEFLKDLHFDDEDKSQLFWGIRGGYVNIYHMGASIAKIKPNCKFKFAAKYHVETKSGYLEWCAEEWMKEYKTLMGNVRRFQEKYKKYEKIAQQKLILANNNNSKSSWYCFDMEYKFARESENEPDYGRFDIFAVNREPYGKKHKILLIELKYGRSAYKDSLKPEARMKVFDTNNPAFNAGSGIVGHVCNYIRYVGCKTRLERLKQETVNILSVQKALGINVPDIEAAKDNIDDEPIFSIITVGCDGSKKSSIDSCCKSMENYLFEGKNSAEINLKKTLRVHGIGCIEKEDRGFQILIKDTAPKKTLPVITLFSEKTLDNLDISEIFDDNPKSTQYDKVGLS